MDVEPGESMLARNGHPSKQRRRMSVRIQSSVPKSTSRIGRPSPSEVIVAGACAIGILSGCAPGPTTPPGPATNASAPAATTAPAVPSSSPTPFGTATTAGAGPGSVASAAVDPRGGSVVCEDHGGEAAIYQYTQQGKSMVPVLTFDRSKVLAGWTLEGTVCGSPLKWAPDFSLYLVAGKPPGSDISHVVAVDVKAGTYSDLTAPRQKSGFSDPVLYERDSAIPSYMKPTRFSFPTCPQTRLASDRTWCLSSRRTSCLYRR